MRLNMVDALRCTRGHAETPLVAAIRNRDGAAIVEGTLGCPVCLREYPIAGGIAYFGVVPDDRNVTHELPGERGTDDDPAASDLAVRAGALLAAREGATLVLAQEWGAAAAVLAELLPVSVYVLNPTSHVAESERVAVVRSSEGVPLAGASVHGVAIGASATPLESATAARALAPAGRLVAPVSLAPPGDLTELARDARFRVSERPLPLVPLGRR